MGTFNSNARLACILGLSSLVALAYSPDSHAFGAWLHHDSPDPVVTPPPAPAPTSTSTPTPTPTQTPTSKPSPTPTQTPTQTPTSLPTTGTTIQIIETIAGGSSCAKYSWKSRGRAPAGYTKGVALSFARSLCRLQEPAPTSRPAEIMSEADTGVDSKDALTHYKAVFSSNNIAINKAGADALRAVYTLGLGLGMRESSGNYCEGWDTSAGSNRPSSSAEAGPFQTSYDSMGASPELQRLYDEYQANSSRCNLDVFKEGAAGCSQGILGTGAGATYQTFNKKCPAFATEYAMVVLRVLRGHFGPINRLEAEVIPQCESMFDSVQQLIQQDPGTACKEVF